MPQIKDYTYEAPELTDFMIWQEAEGGANSVKRALVSDIAAVTGLNVDTLVSSVAHGLVQGDVVKLPFTSKAQGNDADNSAYGIVSSVTDADNFTVAHVKGRTFTWTSHGKGVAGTKLFLDQDTPGAMTSDRESLGPGIIQQVAAVVDANTMMVFISSYVEI